ncbi:MAG TPA: ADP-ribosylglycohydrolase family protein [Verrucomicrobiales bacterium]|jgi:ADP-ribosylglycohydrolase|nr:ADP-ribosylglycohydrolase family protein [Verrucomicrobiales bacterium]
MNENLTRNQRLLGGLWGSLAGDALGVPVEFKSRAEVQSDPVTGMRSGGSHGQPAGTWSDDSSLLLCSAESLVEHEFSVSDMAQRFARWRREGLWTPHGVVFDIGIATSRSLSRVDAGIPPLECGGRDQHDNGNGSLMRILPVCLRFAGSESPVMVKNVENASSITHAHPRSRMACVFFGFFVREVLAGASPPSALSAAQSAFRAEYGDQNELFAFTNALDPRLPQFPESEIRSGGYVMETLTASLWCLLTTNSFSECVLKAVNLGGDTDTTGCVAGGLAGVYYGLDSIPREWMDTLARKEDVARLFNQFVS